MDLPNLVVADELGNIIEIPDLFLSGMSYIRPELPSSSELIPLPAHSYLMKLPGRVAIGFDPISERFLPIREYHGKPVFPVSALLPRGYLQLLRSAYSTLLEAPRLPAYHFTAVGVKDGQMYCAALPTNSEQLLSFHEKMEELLRERTSALRKQFSGNHLVNYFVHHHEKFPECPNALRFILREGEVHIAPAFDNTSPCQDCLPKDRFSKSDSAPRLIQVREPDIIEAAVEHLQSSALPAIRFSVPGNGNNSGNHRKNSIDLVKVIREIRNSGDRGSIVFYNRKEDSQFIKAIIEAGTSAVIFPVNSFQPEFFDMFHQPDYFRFDALRDSVKTAISEGIDTRLEYGCFPGLTNHPDENRAFLEFVADLPVNNIILQNLEVDPDWYIDELELFHLSRNHKSMKTCLEEIKKRISVINVGG